MSGIPSDSSPAGQVGCLGHLPVGQEDAGTPIQPGLREPLLRSSPVIKIMIELVCAELKIDPLEMVNFKENIHTSNEGNPKCCLQVKNFYQLYL